MRFVALCFFQDMHRIQDFIKETWQMYKRQEIDLITASFVTNAAIEIVGQAEVEITEILFPGRNPSWILLADLVTSPERPEAGINPPTINERSIVLIGMTMQAYKITPSDSLVYQVVARTISRFIGCRILEVCCDLLTLDTFMLTSSL